MPLIATIAIVSAGAAVLALVARRDVARERRRRRGLLDACLPLFDEGGIHEGEDGFPRLSGRIGTRRLTLDLIVDTMTIRRLPQLWLRLTILEPLSVPASLAALMRPCGTEFYAVAPRLPDRLDTPADLPAEVLVKAEGRGSAAMLRLATKPLAALLSDPLVKEVAVTRKGLRAVRQVDQGQRGPHLLLRQPAFAGAALAPQVVLALHDGLLGLREALVGQEPAPRPLPAPARRGVGKA
jgi:hypothetical protein